MVKGLGYAIEAIIAMLTILIFSLGAIQISEPEQDWSSYQREVSAHDLTYSMEKTGHTESFVSRAETGSLQTAMTTVSDRDMEISGLVSEIPISEIGIGFYTLSNDTYTESLTTANAECSGDLNEIQDFSSSPIIRTDGSSGQEALHGVTLYFGNISSRPGYDALWVDNGTECQFGPEDGPFDTDEVFFWGDKDTPASSDHYDFKNINWDSSSSTGSAEFYNATQPVRIANSLSPGPNDIRTDITIDMVNTSNLESEDYNIVVFRERQVLAGVADDFSLMKDLIQEGSIMFLMDLQDRNDITDNEFLSNVGIEWIDLNYKNSYSGGLADATFSSEPDSVTVNTYYTGLRGSSNFQLSPPGKVISNTSSDLRPSRTIYSNTQRYDALEWQRNDTDMSEYSNPSSEPDRPQSQCYSNYDSSTEYPLSSGTINFPENQDIGILSAKLGRNSQACNNLIERGIKFDFNDDGDYESDLYLNGENIEINGIDYFIEANVDPSTHSNCDYWGECVNFIPTISENDDFVELMVTRDRFKNLTGNRFAMTGYQDGYSTDQRKALASTIFWLAGSEQNFEGEESPANVDSQSFGSVQGPSYLPYSLYLRWSE